MKPIAITAYSALCAAGEEIQDIWSALLLGKRNLKEPHTLHSNALPYPFLGVEALMHTRKDSALDTFFLVDKAIEKVLKQANINKNARIGVVLGTTAGSALHFINAYAKNGYAKTHTNEDCAKIDEAKHIEIKDIHDEDDYFRANLALEISKKYAFNGPAITLANACTSGADALGIGMELLLSDTCDYVICGGADALSLVPHTGFARLMVYDNEPCRPFDNSRKGLNLGEASAICLLENSTHAKKRNATIHGFITGYGSGSDAHHFTAPQPEGRGLYHAVNQALEQSNISKEDLAFINAHGTGTKENDLVEGRFFKKYFESTPVWASKPITGHTLGAAGALEAIFALLALNNKIVPQSFGFSEPDVQTLLTPTTANCALEKKYALSTSLGFGGGNAAVIVSNNFSLLD